MKPVANDKVVDAAGALMRMAVVGCELGISAPGGCFLALAGCELGFSAPGGDFLELAIPTYQDLCAGSGCFLKKNYYLYEAAPGFEEKLL